MWILGLCSTKHEDKMDVYDFGVILLEIIVGRPITSQSEVDQVKDQVRVRFQHYFAFITSVVTSC